MPIVPGQSLTLADLTTKEIDGSGYFDGLMKSINVHLEGEYKTGRITGQEYTKAYIALTTAALSTASQFLLEKDASYWTGVKAELDAQISEYNLTEIMPTQKKLLLEQIEVQRAQTLDTRTDGISIVGSVGKQKDLYAQQITSYQRDGEVKAAKLFTDAWITQKTIDEGLTAPTGFTNASLDTILTRLKVNNALT